MKLQENARLLLVAAGLTLGLATFAGCDNEPDTPVKRSIGRRRTSKTLRTKPATASRMRRTRPRTRSTTRPINQLERWLNSSARIRRCAS